MKKPTRVFAVLLILICSLVLLGFLWNLVSFGFGEGNDWFSSIGIMAGMTLILVPFVIGLCFGCRLFAQPTKKYIKGCVGVFSFFCATALVGAMKFFLPPDVVGIVAPLIATILVLPFYVLFSKYLIQKDLNETIEKGEVIGKGILVLLAWLIWHALYRLIDLYAPSIEQGSGIKVEPWDTFQMVTPLIGFLFYWIASRFIKRGEEMQTCIASESY